MSRPGAEISLHHLEKWLFRVSSLLAVIHKGLSSPITNFGNDFRLCWPFIKKGQSSPSVSVGDLPRIRRYL